RPGLFPGGVASRLRSAVAALFLYVVTRGPKKEQSPTRPNATDAPTDVEAPATPDAGLAGPMATQPGARTAR
ncbi:hypothetical protein AB0885_31175, partial [Streptomyces sp. NPDC005534]